MNIPKEIKGLLDQLELVEEGKINTLEYYIWKCLKPTREDTNFLWCIGYDYNFSNTYDKCLTAIKELSEVKVYSPNDIYTFPVLYVSSKEDIDSFMDFLDIQKAEDKWEEHPYRVVIKCHAHQCVKGSDNDHTIKSVWFDGIPNMVILEGYVETYGIPDMYITDREKYYEMLSYLYTFSEINIPVISANDKSLREMGHYHTFVQDVMENSDWVSAK